MSIKCKYFVLCSVWFAGLICVQHVSQQKTCCSAVSLMLYVVDHTKKTLNHYHEIPFTAYFHCRRERWRVSYQSLHLASCWVRYSASSWTSGNLSKDPYGSHVEKNKQYWHDRVRSLSYALSDRTSWVEMQIGAIIGRVRISVSLEFHHTSDKMSLWGKNVSLIWYFCNHNSPVQQRQNSNNTTTQSCSTRGC